MDGYVFGANDPAADFDGNSAVDFSDLATMKSFFFSAPGPSAIQDICEKPATVIDQRESSEASLTNNSDV